MIDRFRGTRAATTFRKLPSASPGASANAARATSTPRLSAGAALPLKSYPANISGGFGCAYTAGFDGIPTGTVVTVGKLFVVRLLLRMI